MNEAPSTILIVDDDPLVCDTLERFLSHEGHSVVSTQDGSTTLKLVEEQGVDLVMLDVRMPGEDGLSVLSSLRRSYPASLLPVVVMTGFGDRRGAMEAFELGADDYVTKPIDFPLVAARIQTRLRLRLQTQEERTTEPRLHESQIIAGRYELRESIGQGQFGVVYRAIRLADALPVAIKFLRPQVESTQENFARFRREVETLRLIQHPHAVSVLEFDVVRADRPFLVMELLEGHSLAEELRKQESLDAQDCARIVLPICEVLAEVHEKEIVHRDIKPQNIFLHRKSNKNHFGEESLDGYMVKVLDFGIAKLLDDSPSQELTRDGIGPGTPAYMAPERYYEVPYDGAADIYSLGVMLHEMLVGRLPFGGEAVHPLKLAIQHMTEPAPPLRSFDPKLPVVLEELVLKMLAKEPEERPTARQLLPQLRLALGEAGRVEGKGVSVSDGEATVGRARVFARQIGSETFFETLGQLMRRG